MTELQDQIRQQVLLQGREDLGVGIYLNKISGSRKMLGDRHGQAYNLGPDQYMHTGKFVVDLSADYRLKDPAVYERWYHTPHTHAHLLKDAAYGLPELHREAIAKAKLVASPGCYPTAALLQLAPLFAHDLVQTQTVVIDAKSGISGAGRSPALPYHFPEAHESLEPYKIGQHRHIPEIEQELAGLLQRQAGSTALDPVTSTVTFTPHLVPMNRGILSTAYCRLKKPMALRSCSAWEASSSAVEAISSEAPAFC